jgi:2-phosphosulfolactate phosphatase
VLLVCAGTFEDFALEDAYSAGMLIQELPETELTDAAQAARAVAQSSSTPLATLLNSRNGKVLSARGRRAEVEWCAQRSVFTVVGEMQRAVIRPLQC